MRRPNASGEYMAADGHELAGGIGERNSLTKGATRAAPSSRGVPGVAYPVPALA
jgi:hypothetical protein